MWSSDDKYVLAWYISAFVSLAMCALFFIDSLDRIVHLIALVVFAVAGSIMVWLHAKIDLS